jgi:hypothetical protein
MQFKRPSSSVLRIDFENNIISEASTHNDAHTTPSMSCHAAHTAMTAAFGDIATATSPATLADAHILRSEHFDDRRSRTAASGEPRDARRGGRNWASV